MARRGVQIGHRFRAFQDDLMRFTQFLRLVTRFDPHFPSVVPSQHGSKRSQSRGPVASNE